MSMHITRKVVFGLVLFTLLHGGISSAATRYVWQGSPDSAPPYTNWATAARTIQDAVDAAETGDEIVVTNGVYASGGRAIHWLNNRVAIYKPVIVRSVNGPEVTMIHGYPMTGASNGYNTVRGAYLTNGATLSGFTVTNGVTENVHDFFKNACGGGIWCESTSAVVSNCIIVNNAANAFGGGVFGGTVKQCLIISNTASSSAGAAYSSHLIDCTLTGNSTTYYGGAVRECKLDRCILAANSAGTGGGGAIESTLNHCILTGNSASYGGGAHISTLYSCVLIGNTAEYGGGVDGGTLINCTLAGNSANRGGGAFSGTFTNCILYDNTTSSGLEANYGTRNLYYCCTTPLPTNGIGNFTNAPIFVDLAGGNLRLQSNSPCINAGYAVITTNATDLDGLPRIAGGAVDIGAYEFPNPSSTLPYVWLQQYGLPVDGSADITDTDHDGLNNVQEWRSRTDPTNAHSALRILVPATSLGRTQVTWESVAGVSYTVERSSNLSASPAFQPVATNLVGQAGTTTFTDVRPVSSPPLFYRVRVVE